MQSPLTKQMFVDKKHHSSICFVNQNISMQIYTIMVFYLESIELQELLLLFFFSSS